MFEDTVSRRRMFSLWSAIPALVAVMLAAGVFSVTQSVKQREDRVADINRSILAEQQTMRVLDAEWAYLTRPQRLEELMAMRAEHETGMAAGDTDAATLPAAGVEKAAVVAKTEPAAGAPATAVKTDTVAVVENDADDVKSKVASVKAKPAGKDVVQPVKTAKKTEAPVIKHTPNAGDDLIWSVKHSAARQQMRAAPATARKAPVYPQVATERRGGIVHPIVE